MIVGAHAVNAYSGQPRATADVDVVVRPLKRTAKAVAEAFPTLAMLEFPWGVRFADERLEAIDLLRATGSPLFRRLLDERREVPLAAGRIWLPKLEALLASKFQAMHMPERGNGARCLDAADFSRIIQANRRINLDALAGLADLIRAGDGERIRQCVAEARADRRIDF